MRIQYYFNRIKKDIIFSFRNFRLRKDNEIGKNCIIEKSVVLKGNVKLGAYVRLGKNVELGKNVKIGSNTILRDFTIGENSCVESHVSVTGTDGGKIIIGKECYIGFNIVFDKSASITIGDFVHIGSSLWTHSSAKQCIEGLPLKEKDLNFRPVAPITIESNVYIGVNSTIYPGVTIGHHVIVAPNSVVNKDIEPYSLVGGVPAKLIRKLEQH